MSLVNPSPTTGRPSTPLSGVLMDTEYYVCSAIAMGARTAELEKLKPDGGHLEGVIGMQEGNAPVSPRRGRSLQITRFNALPSSHRVSAHCVTESKEAVKHCSEKRQVFHTPADHDINEIQVKCNVLRRISSETPMSIRKIQKTHMWGNELSTAVQTQWDAGSRAGRSASADVHRAGPVPHCRDVNRGSSSRPEKGITENASSSLILVVAG
ncbi:hypothetical protein BDW22DRAFT_1344803 [Trametopsis cervina]|nr:hypothetical protein BDW22DRAFT_1344803 [Trametopsis cervina]